MKDRLLLILPLTTAFKSTSIRTIHPSSTLRPNHDHAISVRKGASCITLNLSSDDKRFVASPTPKTEIVVDKNDSDTASKGAATSTVNERLMQEIQSQSDTQKYGKSDLFAEFRSKKTEEERRASIEEAKDLNGVNPLVCIGGAAFAWVCAGGLWLFTTYLGVMFASHPVDTDVYFIQRTVGVFRNVVMGLSSLASGFFGVVGFGILKLINKWQEDSFTFTETRLFFLKQFLLRFFLSRYVIKPECFRFLSAFLLPILCSFLSTLFPRLLLTLGLFPRLL